MPSIGAVGGGPGGTAGTGAAGDGRAGGRGAWAGVESFGETGGSGSVGIQISTAQEELSVQSMCGG
jgi:hypothetical protein